MKKVGIALTALWVICLSAGAQNWNITDYDAVGDDSTINTLAIQAAIDACHEAGGGTVYVPPGVFVTGTFGLKSNVNLYLEKGAEIKGSSNINDYKEFYSTGNPLVHYGIIYTHKAENVSITGHGIINGNEEAFFQWDTPKEIEWGGSRHTRQGENFRKVKKGFGDGPVEPATQRPMQMIIFSECTNVRVRDVQLLKATLWTIHFADCDDVLISGVKIETSLLTPNSDGINITSSSNVIVSDCDIRSGDDAIAITGYAGHYGLPGFQGLRHASDNITITNCNLQSRSSGIRIGFTDQNTLRNIHINNVNITNSNRGIGIFTRKEGAIENVTVSQVTIETRLHTGDWWGNGEPIHISAVREHPDSILGGIRNITFRDVTCFSENGILIYGAEDTEIEDIRFYNLRMNFLKSPMNDVGGGNIDLRGAYVEKQLFASDISAFDARYVNRLTLEDMVIKWEDVEEDYFRHGVHIENSGKVRIKNVEATPSPSNRNLSPILVKNSNLYKTSQKGITRNNSKFIR
jgi:polygalacturonase